MLKNLLKWAGQRLLTLNTYLFLFSWLAGWRLRKTDYDPEFRHFLGLIPQEGIILDIGANIGIMTVALAKAKPGCSVYAFEPAPPNLGALRRIIAWHHLTNVKVFPVALGEIAGDATILLPEVNAVLMPGLSHIVEPGLPPAKGQSFAVRMERLDRILQTSDGRKVVALKLDVENYEYFVLKGGRELLQRDLPLIYCELWADDRRDACIGLLTEMGYTPKLFAQGRLIPYEHQPSINLFFIPPAVQSL
ncbi:MAG: FkbM family methyltransferase [Chitinophagaceae bacterium]|nr:FkbM family methyltransferase [Chitinophagaceae bacterium]